MKQSITYKIRCSRGSEVWYAYNGHVFEDDCARTEVESCRKIYPDVHFELEIVGTTVVRE
jgi:hypothetical protein